MTRVVAACTAAEHKALLKELFPAGRYEPVVTVSSAAMLKQKFMESTYDYTVVMAPLTDEYGIRTAMELSASQKTDVLLFVPADKYDQAAYMVRENSVFVLALPVSRQAAWQAVQLVEKARMQIQRIERQLKRSRDKYQELQLVSRCKLLLMENYRWSEQKAHHYIEKTAMDHSITKTMVAKVLLDKMQGVSTHA